MRTSRIARRLACWSRGSPPVITTSGSSFSMSQRAARAGLQLTAVPFRSTRLASHVYHASHQLQRRLQYCSRRNDAGLPWKGPSPCTERKLSESRRGLVLIIHLLPSLRHFLSSQQTHRDLDNVATVAPNVEHAHGAHRVLDPMHDSCTNLDDDL